MNRPHHDCSRRQFLRASGVSLAVPFLSAFAPRTARAAENEVRRRFVAINLGLGFLPENFLPQGTGNDYQPSKYLQIIDEFRDRYTVITGTSHPYVDGGHHAEKSFLTAAPHPGSPSFKNSVSADQVAAREIGLATRYASFSLTTGSLGLSWSRGGVEIPAMTRPSVVFAKMFLEGNAGEKAAVQRWLQQGRSILDLTLDSSKGIERDLGPRDREKLEQYLTAVRETETKLHKAEEWERRPKPKTDAPPPTDIEDLADVVGRTRLMYDIIHLALQSDSTRIVTLSQPLSSPVPPVPGVSEGYHNLTHHGKDPAKMAQLELIELEQMKAFREFLARMATTDDAGGTLLDHTSLLCGSNLGNANSHSNENLPMILAGGGFRHGRHLAFDATKNTPLSNLFVSMLQRLGLEVDSFASSTGTLTGLEAAGG